MSASSLRPSKTPLLSDRLYNVLKTLTMIVLPASGALYVALAQIWDLPRAEAVVGSITATSVFLGSLAKWSSKSYTESGTNYAGVIEVKDDGEKAIFSLNLNQSPEDLAVMPEARFKVNRQ